MAKTVIIDVESKNRVPFLRGVLARSLNSSGLSFKIAHQLATDIRQELDKVGEITSLQLRRMVIKKLEEQGYHKVIVNYQAQNVEAAVIYVENLDGQLTPYSDDNFNRLEVIGLNQAETRLVVNKMHNHLMRTGLKKIHVNHLGYLTYRCLHQDKNFGPKVAERYLSWVNFSRSGYPLVMLIGGTAGCGKSTISTALANRLDIVRTQSTDMLREVMRMMIPQRLLPVLHESSFNAWQTLPVEQGSTAYFDRDKMLVAGYRTQAELLSVPCEAVMQRALKEKISLLLEGVHIAPSLLNKVSDFGPIVVHIMLAVLKQKEVKKRIKGRKLMVPQRSSMEHPATFEDIWRLQEYLLDEADQADVAIVENREKENTIREIMKVVMNKISKKYSTTPAKVFGERHISSKSSHMN
ncbi:MAG: hypothetical protein KAU21_06545 [Gammaproteobacteria bacterium]|nr:hypothetical protein [Gammaproteobacteria bacterium]